ncbi:D-sedoheptulose 7-phosphate isomerase [Mucilaginibacter pallidiroseus]|uniref:Phosphoheptose isomerase n=1 Tax=Mucilaginibacter pallidiroseus TaxID=2599295 RepID=A0A563UBV9_9SPHI|nr:D-sedoheptulose 7-phosphate isomerase [Mucilaginibacter pallidiroseus]TWR28845.1 D-sedoheptulose 7-phosphate isomerase [Mucilaginibacter pallidiroseus]
MILEELNDHLDTIRNLIEASTEDIEEGCKLITETIEAGNFVFLAGNGGSAADAQHIAAELTGRFVKERKPLPGMALTTDTSALTAIANDYGYDHVFSRQLEAFAKPGDLFIAISTSGNSPGILNALSVAKGVGCRTIGLTGRGGGKMSGMCDTNIVVPSQITARVQEMHILIGHIFCKAVDGLFD